MSSKPDQVAIGLSLVCILHCSVPLLPLIFPLLGLETLRAGSQMDYVFHVVLFAVGIPLSFWSLYATYKHHRRWRSTCLIVTGFILLGGAILIATENTHVFFTLVGATVLAIGHLVNFIDYRQSLTRL